MINPKKQKRTRTKNGFLIKKNTLIKNEMGNILNRKIDWQCVDKLFKEGKTIEQVAKECDALDLLDVQYDPTNVNSSINYLLRNGMPKHLIPYIIYPSGRPRSSLQFIPKKRNLPIDKRNNILATIKSSLVDEKSTVLIHVRWRNVNTIISDTIYLPINRYQNSSGSLFFYNDPFTAKLKTIIRGTKEYCGTYFYFEPTSPYLLKSKRTLVVPNKILAFLYFKMQNGNVKLESAVEELIQIIWDYSIEYYLKFYSVKKKYKTTLHDSIKQFIIDMFYGRINTNVFHPFLYPVKDALDQPICLMANNNDIETILLTTVTGEFRLVTEILSTRPRKFVFGRRIFQV